MTFAADDVEHIRRAQTYIKHEATTEEPSPICGTCAGLTFVFKITGFGAPAIPCPECRPRNREVKK